MNEIRNERKEADYVHHVGSPLGGITLASDGEALTGLWFDGQKYFGSTLAENQEERKLPVFEQAEGWLDVYFSGRAPDFTPKLLLRTSAFRREVWEILLEIPYGETITYGEIAGRLSSRGWPGRVSAQAVGGAVGHNPISLIIPCHRVVGSDGSMRGYAGGIDRKLALLRMEQKGKAL